MTFDQTKAQVREEFKQVRDEIDKAASALNKIHKNTDGIKCLVLSTGALATVGIVLAVTLTAILLR